MPQASPRTEPGVGRNPAPTRAAALVHAGERALVGDDAEHDTDRIADAAEAPGICRGDTVPAMTPDVVEFGVP